MSIKSPKRITFVLFVFSLIAVSAYFFLSRQQPIEEAEAQTGPQITSAPASINHKATVTIGGTGFGTKSPAAPYLWDTVDNQAAYSGLSDGQQIPVGTGKPWREQCPESWSPTRVVYSTSRPQRGLSTVHYYGDGQKAYLRGFDTGGNEVRRFYVSWWTKFSHDVNFGTSKKFIRVEVQEGMDVSEPHTTWDSLKLGAGVPGTPWHWGTWGGTVNQWNRLEVSIDGIGDKLKAWTNAQIKFDFVGLNFGTKYPNYIHAIGLDPAEPTELPSDFKIEFDDVYIDTTQARVEIGDKSTWSSCTHREVQIPTAWSSGSITFTANQGSFANGVTAYLYVLDENGNVNEQGQPITFGAAAPDATPPSVPTGVSVQ